jgi:hypothetical protein
MRFDQRFCARTAVTAGLFAAAVSVFGPSPVHAQTKPTVPPAAQPAVVRMGIDDAVATALQNNLDLEVQRINPQIRDLDSAVFKANFTPNFTTNVDFRTFLYYGQTEKFTVRYDLVGGAPRSGSSSAAGRASSSRSRPTCASSRAARSRSWWTARASTSSRCARSTGRSWPARLAERTVPGRPAYTRT